MGSLRVSASYLLFLAYFIYFYRFFASVLFIRSRWSSVDAPLVFSCAAGHLPDWRTRVLLGMVEVQSVNAKHTHTQLYITAHYNLVIVIIT